MIVIKDVSRTNSLWDLGSWAVKCIFLRQLWDCQEDAATMTVTINNLLKGCDRGFYFIFFLFFCTFVVGKIIFIPVFVCKMKIDKETQVRDKNTLDISTLSIIKRLWIIFFLCKTSWIFHAGAYGRFIKTNCSILTITTTIAAFARRTCLKMNNLKSF